MYILTKQQTALVKAQAKKVAEAMADSIESLITDGVSKEVAASAIAEAAMVNGWCFAASMVWESGRTPSRKRFTELAALCCSFKGKVKGNEKDNVLTGVTSAEFLRQL